METQIQVAMITVTVAIVEEWDDGSGPHLEVVTTTASLIEGEPREFRSCQVFGDDYAGAVEEHNRLVERFNRLTTK